MYIKENLCAVCTILNKRTKKKFLPWSNNLFPNRLLPKPILSGDDECHASQFVSIEFCLEPCQIILFVLEKNDKSFCFNHFQFYYLLFPNLNQGKKSEWVKEENILKNVRFFSSDFSMFLIVIYITKLLKNIIVFKFVFVLINRQAPSNCEKKKEFLMLFYIFGFSST